MHPNILNEEYLQSLSYQELLILARKYNVYKHRVKKAFLIKKLIGLENTEAELVRKPSEPNEVMFEEEKDKANESIEDERSKSQEIDIVRRLTFNVTSSNGCNEVIEEMNKAPQCDDARRLTFSISPSDDPNDSLEQSLLKNSKNLEDLGPFDEKSENATSSSIAPQIFTSKEEAPISSAIKCGTVKLKPIDTQSTSSLCCKCKELARLSASHKKSLLAGSGHKTPRTITRSASTNNSRKISASEKKLFGTESGRKLGTLPNFRAIHEKRFKNMESLVEGRERMAKRALNLLSPAALKKPSAIPRLNTFVKENKADSLIGSNLNLKKCNTTLPNRKKRNIERMVRDKQSSISLESARTKSKMHVTGVRTNKRFELQMKMRKT